MTKQPTFKIEWIIELIKEQEPERTDWIEQLEREELKEWFRQTLYPICKF